MSIGIFTGRVRLLLRTLCVASVAPGILAAAPTAQQKRPIDHADQLPVHSYAVPKAPSLLLRDEPALAALADSLRADLEADLAAYEIRDSAALRSYYRALGTIAMLQHRPEAALEYETTAKPAARLLSGITLRPLTAAGKAGSSDAAQVFSKAFAVELAQLPYDSVQAELKTNRARLEMLSPAFLEGRAAAEIDPAAEGGRI